MQDGITKKEKRRNLKKHSDKQISLVKIMIYTTVILRTAVKSGLKLVRVTKIG